MMDPSILEELLISRLNGVRYELLVDILVRHFVTIPENVQTVIRMCLDPELLEKWIFAANAAGSMNQFRNLVLEDIGSAY